MEGPVRHPRLGSIIGHQTTDNPSGRLRWAVRIDDKNRAVFLGGGQELHAKRSAIALPEPRSKVKRPGCL